jgi:hypothetical protein
MTTTWEYNVDRKAVGHDEEFPDGVVMDWLDEHGDHGWELVSIVFSTAGHAQAVFKRPIIVWPD